MLTVNRQEHAPASSRKCFFDYYVVGGINTVTGLSIFAFRVAAMTAPAKCAAGNT